MILEYLRMTDLKRLVKAIRVNLTSDLLKKNIKLISNKKSAGHCYVASEALYHLLGGRRAGLKPVHKRLKGGIHWWLVFKGLVIDPTADQFDNVNYSNGVGCGFLTRKPSKRARMLIARTKRYFNRGE